jgi:RimJ/RimL family protein N-acetyltransferase
MRYEGTRREHYEKWGEYEDCMECGLLASEWRVADPGQP